MNQRRVRLPAQPEKRHPLKPRPSQACRQRRTARHETSPFPVPPPSSRAFLPTSIHFLSPDSGELSSVFFFLFSEKGFLTPCIFFFTPNFRRLSPDSHQLTPCRRRLSPDDHELTTHLRLPCSDSRRLTPIHAILPPVSRIMTEGRRAMKSAHDILAEKCPRIALPYSTVSISSPRITNLLAQCGAATLRQLALKPLSFSFCERFVFGDKSGRIS